MGRPQLVAFGLALAPSASGCGNVLTQPAIIDSGFITLSQPAVIDNTLSQPAVLSSRCQTLFQPAVVVPDCPALAPVCPEPASTKAHCLDTAGIINRRAAKGSWIGRQTAGRLFFDTPWDGYDQ